MLQRSKFVFCFLLKAKTELRMQSPFVDRHALGYTQSKSTALALNLALWFRYFTFNSLCKNLSFSYLKLVGNSSHCRQYMWPLFCGGGQRQRGPISRISQLKIFRFPRTQCQSNLTIEVLNPGHLVSFFLTVLGSYNEIMTFRKRNLNWFDKKMFVFSDVGYLCVILYLNWQLLGIILATIENWSKIALKWSNYVLKVEKLTQKTETIAFLILQPLLTRVWCVWAFRTCVWSNTFELRLATVFVEHVGIALRLAQLRLQTYWQALAMTVSAFWCVWPNPFGCVSNLHLGLCV